MTACFKCILQVFLSVFVVSSIALGAAGTPEDLPPPKDKEEADSQPTKRPREETEEDTDGPVHVTAPRLELSRHFAAHLMRRDAQAAQTLFDSLVGKRTSLLAPVYRIDYDFDSNLVPSGPFFGTPLHLAVLYGDTQGVDWLLTLAQESPGRMAQILTLGGNGCSAFALAIALGNMELIDRFLRFAILDPSAHDYLDPELFRIALRMKLAQHDAQLSPLEDAARDGDLRRVCFWLGFAERFDDLADLIAPRLRGDAWNALHYALARDHLKVALRIIRSPIAVRFASNPGLLMELTSIAALTWEDPNYYAQVAVQIRMRQEMIYRMPTLRNVPNFIQFEDMFAIELAFMDRNISWLRAGLEARRLVDTRLLGALLDQLLAAKGGHEAVLGDYFDFMRDLAKLANDEILDERARRTIKQILRFWREWEAQVEVQPQVAHPPWTFQVATAFLTAAFVNAAFKNH